MPSVQAVGLRGLPKFANAHDAFSVSAFQIFSFYLPLDTLEKNWIDRHGRLPEPVKHLLTIARIKAEAAANNVSSVEISGQRLMLQRNGSPILLDGSRYPRLMKTKPADKLGEALEMLRKF